MTDLDIYQRPTRDSSRDSDEQTDRPKWLKRVTTKPSIEKNCGQKKFRSGQNGALAMSNIEVGDVSKGYDASKHLEMEKNKVVDERP